MNQRLAPEDNGDPDEAQWSGEANWKQRRESASGATVGVNLKESALPAMTAQTSR